MSTPALGRAAKDRPMIDIGYNLILSCPNRPAPIYSHPDGWTD